MGRELKKPAEQSAQPANFMHFREREKGFEPSTSTLARWHSTTELLPQLRGVRTYPAPFRSSSATRLPLDAAAGRA